MTIFRPPTDNVLSFANMDLDVRQTEEGRRAYNLLRHYASQPRGRNVFKLASGAYTENEPADMTTVVKTYYGGHEYEVTADEAADLTANGYGAYLS